jgi:radical SAM protein with 4Fe4S-binding SPASM domain
VEIAEDQTLQADAYEETLNWLFETERREADLQLRATCAPHYFRVVKQRERERSQQKTPALGSRPGHPGSGGNGGGRGALHAATRGCLAGTGVCFVSHVGKVYGCGYMPIEAGDVRRNTLGEIWQASDLFSELRDPGRLEGKCGRCGYVQVCGGCRARAYGSTGDYLAEEPFCAYEPGGRRGVLSTAPKTKGEVEI